MKDATFVWPERTRVITDSAPYPRSFDDERKFALVDVSILFPPGRLTVITGTYTFCNRHVLLVTSGYKALVVRERLRYSVPY